LQKFSVHTFSGIDTLQTCLWCTVAKYVRKCVTRGAVCLKKQITLQCKHKFSHEVFEVICVLSENTKLPQSVGPPPKNEFKNYRHCKERREKMYTAAKDNK
jgi:hypothetical protein